MQRAVIVRHGGPEVLRVEEVPDPVPGPGEVRVRVAAAGVNFADVLARIGFYPDAPKPPMVVGYEVAGTVDVVGERVSRIRAGDRVVALTRFGGYATAVIVPEAFIFAAPPLLSDVEAAALPVTYLTAAIALYRLANLAAGELVLVYGAGGGVGIAATQLAKLRGAVVAGTASAAKLEAIGAIGVDHPIDRERGDVAATVRRVTDGRGADVVLDPIGGRNFSASYALLAPLGRLIMYGVSNIASGERRSLWRAATTILAMPAFRPISLMNHNRAVIGLNLGHLWGERARLGSMMESLLADVNGGRLRPIVSRTFPLERAGEAHAFLQSRSNIGKVVLTIKP